MPKVKSSKKKSSVKKSRKSAKRSKRSFPGQAREQANQMHEMNFTPVLGVNAQASASRAGTPKAVRATAGPTALGQLPFDNLPPLMFGQGMSLQ